MVPVLLLVALLAQTPLPASTDLDVVRGHYATAAYEEALAHIERLPPALVTPDLERYRALCLMALGRPEEGTLAFERLVRQAPLYDIPETDLSPRMLALFRDVRQRVLPLVVREHYNRGKASIDAKQYDTAVAELRDVIALLDGIVAGGGDAAFADLRQLADGFLRLAEAEIALAARAAAIAEAPAALEPAPEPAPPPPPADSIIVERIVVYSRDDQQVIPPVEISRFMPPWSPPPAVRYTAYRGELEIVVDEAGHAENARMLRPTHAAYDVALLGATSSWRFEPARRDGVPVKYRLTFDVVLTPPAR